MSFERTRCLPALVLLTAFSLAGCGEKPPPTKTASELTEAEKQQVRELNEQRTDEWGRAVKKK